MTRTAHALMCRNLSKTFPGQRALDNVALDVHSGEIHCLIGQNGSGKSTLVKVLSGYHRADSGSSLLVGGEEVDQEDLRAGRAGIRFVHQDNALVPTLSARENLSLTVDRAVHPLLPIHRRREQNIIDSTLDAFGVQVDVDVPIAQLSPHQAAAISIARALGQVTDETAVLVLDEPTASLGARESKELRRVLFEMRERGLGIIYVSHILEEVLAIADRISILRDGRIIGTVDAANSTHDELVSLMLGDARAVPFLRSEPSQRTSARLRINNLTTKYLSDFTMEAYDHEVVGVTGLLGSGYETLGRALLGIDAWRTGSAEVDGEVFGSLTPTAAIAAGLAIVPSDRRRLGIIEEHTIAENVTLPRLSDLVRGLRLSRVEEDQQVLGWLAVVETDTRNPHRQIDELSGGNQQKVLLAKWLRLAPSVLIVEEPTQAVDVGAKASIERILLRIAADGGTVVISSNDAADLARLCHRVVILREGRIATVLAGAELNEHRIMLESQGSDGALPNCDYAN